MLRKMLNLWPFLGLALAATVLAQGPGEKPTQAVAPADIIAPTIGDMPKGTQATVPPDALIIDDAKKVWLNKIQPVGGDTGVIVHYMKDGTYEVEIRDDKLRWLTVPISAEMRKIILPVKTLHLRAPEKK
jgi:hypothetical protein